MQPPSSSTLKPKLVALPPPNEETPTVPQETLPSTAIVDVSLAPSAVEAPSVPVSTTQEAQVPTELSKREKGKVPPLPPIPTLSPERIKRKQERNALAQRPTSIVPTTAPLIKKRERPLRSLFSTLSHVQARLVMDGIFRVVCQILDAKAATGGLPTQKAILRVNLQNHALPEDSAQKLRALEARLIREVKGAQKGSAYVRSVLVRRHTIPAKTHSQRRQLFALGELQYWLTKEASVRGGALPVSIVDPTQTPNAPTYLVEAFAKCLDRWERTFPALF